MIKKNKINIFYSNYFSIKYNSANKLSMNKHTLIYLYYLKWDAIIRYLILIIHLDLINHDLLKYFQPQI